MTGPDDVSRETSTPWRQYQNREHAARDQYLAVTRRAHHEYLSGPWPDRDYYLTVERDAYATYYAAGRDAWKTYRTDMETAAEPKPAPRPESNPYPPAGLSVGSSAYWPTERDVAPYPPADHSVSGAGVPYPAPSFTARPEWPICGAPYFPADADDSRGIYCRLRPGHPGPHDDLVSRPASFPAGSGQSGNGNAMWADPPQITPNPESES